MSNEAAVAEARGWRRKSARILALEEREKERRKSSAVSANNTNNTHSRKGQASLTGNVRSFQYQQLQHRGETMNLSPLSPLKRGRKQRRLEDLDVLDLEQSKSQQDGKTSKRGNSSTKSGQPIIGLPTMPERRFLGAALDIMQRRDTMDIFAQPVDPEVVENYYSIIKEPMDFGTMRTKLQQGNYTSLEQYENDMFLVFRNAMHFNSSTTIYYKEARAMQGLAEEVLHTLRTDPDKLQSEFSITRGRPGKKSSRARQTRGSRKRAPRPTGVRIGASSLGPRDGRNSALTERETSPPVYRPWSSFCSQSENLVSSVANLKNTLVEEKAKGDLRRVYKQSLLRYAEGLGPVPRRTIASSLIECLTQAQTSFHTEQKSPVPAPSPAQKTASHNAQSPITSLQTSTRTPNLLQGRNTYLNLNVQPSPNDLMPPPKEPIHNQARRGSSLGKMPMSNNNAANPTTDSVVFGNATRKDRTSLSDNRALRYFGRTYARRKALVPRQEVVKYLENQCWLASHLKVIPVEDPDSPNGKKFMTVDMMMKDSPPICDELSANWKSRLNGLVQRGNTFLTSFNLFPSLSKSSGSSAQRMASDGGNWLHLMRSIYYNSTQQADQSSEVYGIDKSTLSTLQGLLTHEYTPLPSWNKLGVEFKRPANRPDHHRQVGPNRKQLLLKNTDQEPNLSLQL